MPRTRTAGSISWSRVDGSLIRSVDVSARLTGNHVLTGLAVDTDGKLLDSSTHGVLYQFNP